MNNFNFGVQFDNENVIQLTVIDILFKILGNIE